MVTNLKARAYRHIRLALLDGELGDGMFLSPAKLAEKIGVSDTPVREAIIQVESEGLVERVPKLGIRARTLNRQELEEMFDLRIILESGAAKLAARQITGEQLGRLQENCRQHLILLKEVRTLTRNKSGNVSPKSGAGRVRGWRNWRSSTRCFIWRCWGRRKTNDWSRS